MHPISFALILVMVAAFFVPASKRVSLTLSLTTANIAIFIVIYLVRTLSITGYMVFYELAYSPVYLHKAKMLYTLFTSMFLHASVLHILSNMVFFAILGIRFEEMWGYPRVALVYIISGIFGALAYTFANPDSTVLLVGASGAIFGVLGAFAAIYPRERVIVPIPIGPILLLREVPVFFAFIAYALIETLLAVIEPTDTVAHVSHLGGVIAGIVFAKIINAIAPPRIVERGGKRQKIDLRILAPLATSERMREIYDRIMKEDVDEVRMQWVDEFIAMAVCPSCGRKGVLRLKGNRLVCDCGWESSASTPRDNP